MTLSAMGGTPALQPAKVLVCCRAVQWADVSSCASLVWSAVVAVSSTQISEGASALFADLACALPLLLPAISRMEMESNSKELCASVNQWPGLVAWEREKYRGNNSLHELLTGFATLHSVHPLHLQRVQVRKENNDSLSLETWDIFYITRASTEYAFARAESCR